MEQHIVKMNVILIGLLTIIALPVLPTVVKGQQGQGQSSSSYPQSRILVSQQNQHNSVVQNEQSHNNNFLGGDNNKFVVDEKKDQKNSKLAVLYDSSGIDRQFQMELLSAVNIALRDLSDGPQDDDPILVQYIDLGKIIDDTHNHSLSSSSSLISSLVTSAQWMVNNGTSTLVSLLEPEILSEFTKVYEHNDNVKGGDLKIISPRLAQQKKKNVLSKTSVDILNLQMSEMALSTALLNRVEKIQVKTLIPILDRDNSAQLEFLGLLVEVGRHRMDPIEFSQPIFVSHGEPSSILLDILNDEKNADITTGILMLATHASQSVMETANESKNLLQMRWFSPSLMEYEEWAGTTNNNATFGIYSVHFVGANGWDNPSRTKTLRELHDNHVGASPRILSSILTYDAVWVAKNHMKNTLSFPMQGLSGEITFDANGFRREGLYFGVSAVAELVSPLVSLLQPSTWILEDVLHLVETIEGQYLITDYIVATSSMLTRDELLRFATQTTNSSDCQEHAMEITSHDPFNQMPHSYSFTKKNLPLHLLIPNHHGYGITFMCQHGGDRSETTLKIACTPSGRFNDPVKCFRSHLRVREKRDLKQGYVPSTYRAYPGYNQISSNTVYPQSPYSAQGGQYSFQPRANPRDDPSNTYYAPPQVTPGYPGTLTSRFDVPIQTDETTPPAPTPVAPAQKLPELRQVLKAAKPFVGSCVGAATGCATCVLVLGRLPLGTLPPACTGPCFVGVFGSCGALLGRAFSETTVICTELFRQGYLDMDTFLVDAEFGRKIQQESPMTLKGYQILASPLVERMRKSKQVTDFVSKFAIPWAKHMTYMMGYSEEFNWLGYGINMIGTPVCFTVGYLHSWLFSSTSSTTTTTTTMPRDRVIFSDSNLSTTALLTLTLISLFLHHVFQSRKKSILDSRGFSR